MQVRQQPNIGTQEPQDNSAEHSSGWSEIGRQFKGKGNWLISHTNTHTHTHTHTSPRILLHPGPHKNSWDNQATTASRCRNINQLAQQLSLPHDQFNHLSQKWLLTYLNMLITKVWLIKSYQVDTALLYTNHLPQET